MRDVIKNCDICQRHNRPIVNPKQASPLYKLESQQPGQVLAVDLLDLSSKTATGFKYALVAIDLCSRFGFAVPIRNKTANTVARAFESGVLANSVLIPKTVLSDNDPEFKSKLFQGMLNKYDISQEFSIPYRPKSNEMVERLNRTICERLAAVVDGDYRHWDTFLPKVMVQYNRTVHGETNRTPVSFYTEIVEEPVIARRFDVSRPPGENFEPYKIGDLVLCKIQFYGREEKT